MKIAFDAAELAPLIEHVVQATLAQLNAEQRKFNGRIGYPEGEAAELLGIEKHVLRDCRLRGEIHARMIGRRYVYSADALKKFLER